MKKLFAFCFNLVFILATTNSQCFSTGDTSNSGIPPLESPERRASTFTLGYHPACPLFLGYGVDALNPSESKLSPFISVEAKSELSGVEKQSFSVEFVTQAEQLEKGINTSISLGGVLFFKDLRLGFDGSFHRDRQMASYSDSLYMVITQRTSFGKQYLGADLKLNDQAQKLVDTGNYSEFIRRYGTHYVATQSRGASCSAVVTVSNISRRSAEYLGLVAGAEIAKVDGVGEKPSGYLNATYAKFISHATQYGALSLNFYASGGTAIAVPEVAVTDIEKIVGKIREQSKSVDIASAPIEYSIMAPYSNFGIPDSNDVSAKAAKERSRLGSRYLRRLQLMDYISHCHAALSQLRLTQSPQSEQLRAQISNYEKQLMDLENTSEDVSIKLGNLPPSEPFEDDLIIEAQPNYGGDGYLDSITIVLRATAVYTDLIQKILIEKVTGSEMNPSPVFVRDVTSQLRSPPTVVKGLPHGVPAREPHKKLINCVIDKIEWSDQTVGEIAFDLKENQGVSDDAFRKLQGKKNKSVEEKSELAMALIELCARRKYQAKLRTMFGNTRYFIGSPNIRALYATAGEQPQEPSPTPRDASPKN